MSMSSALTCTFRTAAIFSTASSFSHTFSGIPTISMEFFLEYCSSVSILSYSSSVSRFFLLFYALFGRLQFRLKLTVARERGI